MFQLTPARDTGATSASMTAFRYVLFAVISTIVNFMAQHMVIVALPMAPLVLSILFGTAAGFAVKYVLDKKWVFEDDYTTGRSEMRKVSLYALFSVGTTVIFWAFEITAWVIWQTDFAKYTGGALGLAIGYCAKYALDKRYTFRTESA